MGIILDIFYIAIIVVAGIAFDAQFELSIIQYLIIISETFLLIIAYSAIFTFVAMLCSNVTLSTTINMLLFLAMFVICSMLSSVINTPKEISNIYWENDTAYIIFSEPNPNYPSELKMKICKLIYYNIPIGQGIELSDKRENVNHLNFVLHLVGDSVIFTGFGIYFFNKKELK